MDTERLRQHIKIPSIPICFTGMGLFRAWTETVYTNGFFGFPTHDYAGQTVFDFVAVIVLIIMALSAKRVSPLYTKKYLYPLTGFCMISSACLNFASSYYPLFAPYIAFPAAILGGIGIALIILLWSELFGCLNPLRIGLYISAGIVASTLVLWLFKGLVFEWLWVCTCLVPIVSLWFLKKSYSLLPVEERPHKSWGSFTVPWKPIAIIGLYSFSFGLCTSIFNSFLGMHDGVGGLVVALLVIVAISATKNTNRFLSAIKLAFPLMLISLVPFGFFLSFGEEISAFCAQASYTLCLIMIMVILGNLSYRYGANAVFIFGIERAVRLLSVQGGIKVREAMLIAENPALTEIVLSFLIAIAICIATVFLFSEKQLSSSWGIVLKNVTGDGTESYQKKHRLSARCSELASNYKLTSREEEIVLLLAQGKRSGDIAAELFVAQSTIKTHKKHIYQKLDIHSKEDLMVLLGLEERSSNKSA